MAVIDKTDLKTGFWLGLGLIGALIAWGLLSLGVHLIMSRRPGDG